MGENDPKEIKPQESLTDKDLKNFVDEKEAAILIEKDKTEIDKLQEGKEEHEKEKRRHEEEIRKADEKMEAIQRSTRTLIPQFAVLHNYCRMRLSWYYKWHTNRYSSLVHLAVLFTCLVGLAAYIYFSSTLQ